MQFLNTLFIFSQFYRNIHHAYLPFKYLYINAHHVQLQEDRIASVHDVGAPLDGDQGVQETVESLHPGGMDMLHDSSYSSQCTDDPPD